METICIHEQNNHFGFLAKTPAAREWLRANAEGGASWEPIAGLWWFDNPEATLLVAFAAIRAQFAIELTTFPSDGKLDALGLIYGMGRDTFLAPKEAIR